MEAAIIASGDRSGLNDLGTRFLRTLLVPHANDRSAVVLQPFWSRFRECGHGLIAGKIGSHGPHHRFGRLGRLPHVQVNVWRLGVKGSGRAFRVPYVRVLSVPVPWLRALVITSLVMLLAV